MSFDRYLARRQKLLQALKRASVEVLLVSHVNNVRYLTGFTGDSSFLLIGAGLCLIVSDGRYKTQLSQECGGLDVLIRAIQESLVEATARVVKRAKLRNLGIESAHVTLDQFEKLKEATKTLELKPVAGAVEALREVKDADEIAEIRGAIRLAEKGFEVARAELRADLTERQVAHNLEHTMRQFGAQGASFPTIVAVGPRSALPHAGATDERISSDGFVLIDWGATATSGYRSDLTRVLVTGKLSPKLEKVYGVVLKAQQAAIRAVRAGARC